VSVNGVQQIGGNITLQPSNVGAEPAKGTDDNYVTDAEKTVIQNTSGENTGDQDLSGLVPYTGATANVDLGAYAQKASKFQLKTDAINTLSQGEIGWNAHDLCPEFKANGATIQVNQEQNLTIKNATGSTLLNGRFVRITGYDAVNNYYLVTYSDNSAESTMFTDFMLTEDILDGGIGTGIKNGIVHDINTLGGTQGGVAYLGTNGQFQATAPAYPAKQNIVGTYGKIDETTGDILVELNKTTQYVTNTILNELDLKSMQNPGICQMCPIYANDIVIDYTALTLTIATIKNGQAISAANPIIFYTDGSGIINKWEKTAPVVFSFSNLSGVWYYHFDNSGNPIATQTPWTDFNLIATVYRILWNATLAGSARSIGEAFEAHLNDTSAADHAWKHAQGSIWVSGGDAVTTLIANTNGVPNTTPNADGRNTVVSLTSCKVSDDGLEYTSKNSTDGLKFSQDLGHLTSATLNATNSGLFQIRIQVGGLAEVLPATRFPFAWDVATNRPQYITTAGVRTLVTDNRWFVYYLYQIQDPRNGSQIRLVSEITDFTSWTLAQASTWDTLKTSITAIQDNEIRPLQKLIFYANNSGGGSYNVGCKYSALVSIDNYRTTRVASVGTAVGSILASNAIVTPTATLLSTNVQSALEELDNEKVSIATNYIYDQIALSNNGADATDLSVGVKLTETVTHAATWQDIAASVATAPTGGTLIVNIKKNGTSIFSTLVSIDATEKTSVTAATPYVFTTNPTVWAVGDVREYSISQVGAIVAGKGLITTVKKTT
jgi:hypothetical protein